MTTPATAEEFVAALKAIISDLVDELGPAGEDVAEEICNAHEVDYWKLL